MMNLQQIGRNYYNPKDPVSIPNHRFDKMDTQGRQNDFFQCCSSCLSYNNIIGFKNVTRKDGLMLLGNNI